jgi:hypothetical protein
MLCHLCGMRCVVQQVSATSARLPIYAFPLAFGEVEALRERCLHNPCKLRYLRHALRWPTSLFSFEGCTSFPYPMRYPVKKTGGITGCSSGRPRPNTGRSCGCAGCDPTDSEELGEARTRSRTSIQGLEGIAGLLSKYIENGQVASWMDSPNEAFRNRTPRELIREGKTRDLILEFGRLRTGEPL